MAHIPMGFPPGKSVLAMLLISGLSGGWLLVRPRPPRSGELHVWVFAEPHANAYRKPLEGPTGREPSLAELYRQRTGKSVSIDLISAQAEALRLVSLFNSDSHFVPDLAEVEIGAVGMFFRPPADQVGFLPLNRFLERDGLMGGFVRPRLAPYSKGGVVLGVPQDVHPVVITYRKDLFDEAGVELGSARTWDEFQEKCVRFQDYFRGKGVGERWGLELPIATPDVLTQMLLQRHINIVDDEDGVHLNDPKVTDTLVRYALMVAGPRRIGAPTTAGPSAWTAEFARGEVCALLTADWRIGDLQAQQPGLAGRCAVMPLPRFEPGDAPTSTWGGTMIGIPRRCADPEASWALLKFLCLSPEAARAREQYTHILPALQTQWDPERYGQPDPYFGGQKAGLLLIEMARAIPARNVSSHSLLGSQALSLAMFRAINYVRMHGSDDGLTPLLQGELDGLAAGLARRLDAEKVR